MDEWVGGRQGKQVVLCHAGRLLLAGEAPALVESLAGHALLSQRFHSAHS